MIVVREYGRSGNTEHADEPGVRVIVGGEELSQGSALVVVSGFAKKASAKTLGPAVGYCITDSTTDEQGRHWTTVSFGPPPWYYRWGLLRFWNWCKEEL